MKSPLLPGQVEVVELSSEQVRALSSVACSDVFSAFDAHRPMSIREVAVELQKSPASVGAQVSTLSGVGLLVPSGERKRRSRIEQLWVHKGLATRLIIAKCDQETLRTYNKRFDAQMRRASRLFSMAQQASEVDPSLSTLLHFRWKWAYMTPEHAREISKEASELQVRFEQLGEEDQLNEQDGLVRVSLVTIMLPSSAESRKRINGFGDE